MPRKNQQQHQSRNKHQNRPRRAPATDRKRNRRMLNNLRRRRRRENRVNHVKIILNIKISSNRRLENSAINLNRSINNNRRLHPVVNSVNARIRRVISRISRSTTSRFIRINSSNKCNFNLRGGNHRVNRISAVEIILPPFDSTVNRTT